MDIVKIISEKMSQNSYLVIKDGIAILIDAGVSLGELDENLKLFSPKPKLKAVFLTHCHFDHIVELDNILNKYSCVAYIYKDGKNMLYDENKNLSYLDSPFKIKAKKEIKTFKDSDVINIDNIEVKCFNTPGHSIDSSCFVIEDNMFTGDTIFKVEVGRTDLYSGDDFMQRISLERINNELSECVNHFYAGHGANFELEDLKYNIERLLGDF